MAGQRPRAGQGRRLSISQGRFHLSLSRGDGAEEPLAAVLGGTGWPRRRSPSRRGLCNLWSYESKTNPFVANASPAEDTSLGSAVFGSESRPLPPALMAGFSAADQNQMRVLVSPRKETGGQGGSRGYEGATNPLQVQAGPLPGPCPGPVRVCRAHAPRAEAGQGVAAPGHGVQDHSPAAVLGSVRDGEARGPGRERVAPGAGGRRPRGGVTRPRACSSAAATGPLSWSVLSRCQREHRRLPEARPALPPCPDALQGGSRGPGLHPGF